MAPATDCTQNFDPLRLVREGTSQGQRSARALDPASAPVDGRSPAHDLVFAQGFAAFLKYLKLDNTPDGDWTSFLNRDLSSPLALAAVQDIDSYKVEVKSHF